MFPHLKGVKRLVCSYCFPLIPFRQLARGCEGAAKYSGRSFFVVIQQGGTACNNL